MNICAVVMAGGFGSRLWPFSRSTHPKQFLSLHGRDTMLQATFRRLQNIEIRRSITICNEEHRFFVAEQLREMGQLDTIILEPTGRNTAPAIALAAIAARDNDPLMLILAADHVIKDQAAFEDSVKDAIPLAEAGQLVTFGVVPTQAHTGYGYIKKGEPETPGFLVDKFVEKPTEDLAKRYLATGDYLWNSGMFLIKASRYLEELEKFRPDILEPCTACMLGASSDLDFLRVDKSIFETCPSDSIDYAVMEKTNNAVVVPMDAGWSDVGSWSSLWEIENKDENNNVAIGDVILHETRNSYVKSDGRLVAMVGVDDLVVTATKDAILVADKKSAQDVKAIVDELKTRDRSEWRSQREVYRPWGKYDSIDQGERYQVKRITVKPGEKLSVQKHHHRAEHWVVVSGSAKVTNGDKQFTLSENESTYIPIGVVHALENPGTVQLEVIEVQSGIYLGEDDIVRLQDRYGRSS